MTTEEREARLTAYALNDPGLSVADRQEVETVLAADPAVRREVEETRQLADLLTAGLAAEQAALPAEPAVTIPTPTPVRAGGWTKYVVAAAVLVAVAGGTYLGLTKWKGDRENEFTPVAAKATPGEGGSQYGPVDYDARDPSPKELKDDLANPAAKPDGGKGDPRAKEATEGDGKPVGEPAKPADPARQAQPGRTEGFTGLVVPAAPPAPAVTSPLPGPGSGTGAPGPDGPPAKRAPTGPGGLGGYPPGGGAPPGTLPPGGAPGGPFGGGGLRPGMPRPSLPGPAAKSGGAGGGKGPAGGYAPGTRVPTEAPPAAEPTNPGEKGGRKGLPPGDSLDKDTGADRIRRRDESEKKLEDESGRHEPGNDRHLQLIENPFIKVTGLDALSTFGVDVDTASYAIVRKYLTDGQLPPASAVRLEEMVNYFPYADKPPAGDDPFAVSVEMAECPWEPAHRLVRLGLKAKTIDRDKRPPSNLVFLVDVSGSMDAPNRLPLVKESLKLLVGQLGDRDRVAIVVYAGSSGMVLDSTSADRKETILGALDRLQAGGSTNGAGGIQQAYEVAANHFIKGGTNRVVLCTDGDWNVGTTSTDALVKLIEQKRETGVFLSVFGFGMGNLRDEMMVQLAGKGNGNYGYIDTLREANKVFVEQLTGTLVAVAKDVKIQIEFNPASVKAYRLLGYEKRALAARDFHDDKKDAGEMGAGHVVTALYELVPVGAPDPTVGKVDGLRYQKDAAPARPAAKPEKADEAFVVKMRHKKPDGDTSVLRELPVKDSMVNYEKASEDFQFAAAVASFSMLLRDSQYKGHANYGLVLELADAAKKHDPGGYRAEFIDLVKKARALSGK